MPAPPPPEFPDPPKPTSFRAPERHGGGGGGEELRLMWKIAALGFQFVAVAATGVVIGWVLDRWLGTSPRWTAICAVLGIVLGIFEFIRMALRLNRRLDQHRGTSKATRHP